MLIDWTTVAAQIVNLLVLVVVLKYLLYDRIIAAMDARERHIAERIAAAERTQQEAAEEAATLRRQRAALTAEQGRLLDEARDTAERTREELTRAVRADIDELRRRWTGTLDHERRRVLRDLQERTGQQVVALTRRALADLADAELEAGAIGTALARLAADGAIERLAARAAATGEPLEVHTAFPLTQTRRDEIAAAIAAQVGDGPGVTFAIDPGLVCGLELRAAGEGCGWSLAGYLEDLAVAIDDALPTADGELT
jgi:F-type H+-transporting ATPase subunit b